MAQQKIGIIGAGFAGLSAAAHLAKAGAEVTVYEKHHMPGGRARKFEAEGFTFDMGPSWYWMPGVFEAFFEHFGKAPGDYYDLRRLDPSYQVIFDAKNRDKIVLPAGVDSLSALFEQIEPGSSKALKRFLAEARYKYEVGMQEFVQKPSHSIWEFADLRILMSLFRLQMFSSIAQAVRKNFQHPQLRQILEFPVLFLGATPENTPALYSLMNYADMGMGTWYPMGGMHEIAKAMAKVAEEQGAQFAYGAEITKLNVEGKKVHSAQNGQEAYSADFWIAGADYHHVEQQLLPASARRYSEQYWQKRTMAPSSLLFYLGVDEKVKGLLHHNLFFDEDFGRHAREIYDDPKWPEKPLFYVCCPSKTDPSVAPEGKENLFLLVPVAPGLTDDDEPLREQYYHLIMERLEAFTGQSIRDKVVYKRSYAHRDFQKDYHAFKGNAYGLANTLWQTAFLKPKLKSKLNNLFYTGQLTTPGPGVPPSIISGEVVAREVLKKIT